ncbi:MAG: sigma-54-dependent Fis family transcriptional regulator [Desulfobulbaceae bacterium]|jgi:two-component system response regulator AtoC|nr:sigma-54-dependent Fis family transcriptional regulator [Desulfobulbaceae bacterium]
MQSRIFLIDDEQDFLESLERGLLLSGFRNIRAESDPRKAAALFQQGESADIAIIDITMPGMTGVELLDRIRSCSPATECIMVTAADEASLAVSCIKKGAFDYRVKPLNLEELLIVIAKALERKNFLEIQRIGKQKKIPDLLYPEAFAPIITQSEKMLQIMKEAELHAARKVPVLITGETGTGKELLAQAIHRASSRAGRTFTPVNMSSMNATLFEAEFYGHTKGAFTGATQDRKGYLETTSGGTLFLDEIGSLPLELQGKLLRVLQEGEYFKLGVSRPLGADVRFIAATNAELDKLQDQGLFRKDLFYRLCGAWLDLPPLRERGEDLVLLVEAFLRDGDASHGSGDIEEPAWAVLSAYDYPGNVRELKSIVQYAASLAKGKSISIHHLPAYVTTAISKKHRVAPSLPPESVAPLADVEKDHILKAYRYTGENKLQTARLLEIGLNTLRRKLQSYGIV